MLQEFRYCLIRVEVVQVAQEDQEGWARVWDKVWGREWGDRIMVEVVVAFSQPTNLAQHLVMKVHMAEDQVEVDKTTDKGTMNETPGLMGE